MVTDDRSQVSDEISLLESLNREWFKLPLSIMRDVGPAVQTLAGLLRITNKETYVSAAKLAVRSRLPVATVRKHLVTLHEHEWIDNAGRGHTRAGRARRTCTIKVTAKAKDTLGDYAILPWWACCSIAKVGRLPWSAKALLSLLMSRLAVLRFAAQDSQGLPSDDEFWGSLDNMGGEDRFRFSLDRIERDTGLHRGSIVDAKRRLAGLGIVEWKATDTADVLFPRDAFRVVVTPASEGCCFVSLSGGAENGQ